jgi:hypothetical protein
MPPTKTHQLIDRSAEGRQGKGFRRHLGASIIGKECARQIWYVFHWAKRVYHRAQLLRLFDRGNREEPAFIKLIQQAGIEVLDRNPETGEQFRVSAWDGHFGGSLDAKLRGVPDWQELIWLLGEFKTHNDKNFKKLKKEGLQKAYFAHYVQMQIYMRMENLPAGIYFAINKNDDEIHTELVLLDAAFADSYIDRAGRIISAQQPPEKISEEPSWFACNFCDFQDICHFNAPMAFNCRSCIHAKPVEGGEQEGKWLCSKYDYPLSEADQHRGCADHTPYHGPPALPGVGKAVYTPMP